MLVGEWTAQPPILALGMVIGGLPLFSWGWLRASVAVKRSPDDAKKRRFRRLNQRLIITALLGVLAFAALAVIFRLFGHVGDERLFLGFIPLALMLVLVLDAGRTWLAILQLR
jgi:hypothetical protein